MSHDTDHNNGYTAQARCQDMPNDTEDGHYWAWCNHPSSIPSHFKKCMTCGRIDASEAIAQHDTELLGEIKGKLPAKDNSKQPQGSVRRAMQLSRNMTLKEVKELIEQYLPKQATTKPPDPIGDMFTEMGYNVIDVTPDQTKEKGEGE